MEKHEALLNNGDIISQESTVDGINFGDVKVVRRIGLGTHAEVYEVLPCRSDVCHVRMALKIEKPIKHASGFIDQEILVLASVASGKCVPNIVGVYTKDICGTVCRGFCMELYHDSLSSLKAQRTLLDISVIRDSFLEFLTGHMFSAVVQFHKYGYLHRDIKPSNFMFKITNSNHSVNFSLVDFGSSVAIGERNPSEFRGTGAYAPVESDPWLSRIEDDYWSVIFSVVDLCIPGGLPWRSLSARNDDGRAELVLQKRAFFQSINDSVSTDITSKIPSRVKDLIKEVITNEEKMKNVIEEFVSDTNFPPSSISDFIDLFLTPPLVRLNLPKSIGPRATPASVLLNGSCRTHIINDCELPSATASVLFSIPCNSDQTLMKAQAILHQAAANKHIGRTPDVSALGERICLTELSGGVCDPKCPLRHLACTGISRSAIIRSTSRIRKICFDDLFDKCNENCGKLHLDPDTVRRMYIDNQVPAGQPSKRSKHS